MGYQSAFRPYWAKNVVWTLLIILAITSCSKGQEDLTTLCRSNAARHSCGECIKQNPQCVWCTDPAYAGDYRCDVETNLVNSCPPQFLYQAKSNVQVTENVDAGLYEPQLGRIRQIQPQVVHVLIKPGETVTFPLKYYHVEEQMRDIYVLNSETESAGVQLSYSVDCKGHHKDGPQGRECQGVRNSDLIIFTVTVAIRGCSSNAVISIGLSGVREVVALYVHPQCGCDCERPEKQEQKSSHCSGWGTLVCGSCLCDDPRKGGRHCECDLAPGQTTSQLEDGCRQDPNRPICNGHGYCNCGSCVCDPPTQYSGRFCDCDYSSCPVSEKNNQECGGRGRCSCGACECEPGWTGLDCTCSTDTDDCLSDDDKLCSSHGSCRCNKCTCVDGYEGIRCEHRQGLAPPPPPPQPTFQPSEPMDTHTTEDHEPDDNDDDDDDDDQPPEGDHPPEEPPPMEPSPLEPTPADAETEAPTVTEANQPPEGSQPEPEPEPSPEPAAEPEPGAEPTTDADLPVEEGQDPVAGTDVELETTDGEPTAEPHSGADESSHNDSSTQICTNVSVWFIALVVSMLFNRR